MSDTERATRGAGPAAAAPSGPPPESVSFWEAFRAPSKGPAFVGSTGQAPRWRPRALKWLFPSIWLVFLAGPVATLAGKGGAALWIGVPLVLVFAVLYIVTMVAGWSGQRVRFLTLFATMVAITVATAPLMHENVFSLFVYIAVLLVAGFRRWAFWGVAALTAIGTFGPALVGWTSLDETAVENVITLPLVALAMFGFFSLVDTNRALAAARTEVVRLAAENERTRIARDLHDLLGHSLTTITVKVGLARKLAERDGSTAVVEELRDVEAVARRSLREVRAAVSGYTEVTLAGELATSRAVLRAAGIGAELPGAVDIVDPTRSELFGWVVREGVTNVVRHSRASTCHVSLGATWIEVVDDGHGVEHLSPDRDPGHGLTGLQERVEAAGGTLHCGVIRGGWRLRADVPGHGGSWTIRILLADDQALIRTALAALLQLDDDFEVVAQVGRGDEVVAAALATRPDVALLDIEMPGIDGLAAAATLRAEVPSCRVLMVTTFGRPGYLRRAMEAGAAGFVVKDTPAEQLADAVRRVAAGEHVVDPALAAATLAGGTSPLTARERDVLVAARDGATVADIAGRLFLSEGTVRNYLSAAIAKCQVRNRVEAVRLSDERGWL